MKPVTPALTFAFQVHATLAAPLNAGELPNGLGRRIVGITGGTVEGPALHGVVLPGGADSQTIHSDGLTVIDARYTIQTHDGQLIFVSNVGIRHAAPDVLGRLAVGDPVEPHEYYFRTSPTLEAAAPELAWLRRSMWVCSGARGKDFVAIDFYRVE